MHIKGWCAALGAAALFQGASATVTVESTYTSTKTVVRVMEPTGDNWSSSSSKLAPTGTGVAHGTGWSGNSTSKPTWSASSHSAPAVQTTGAASHIALDTLGLAAIAGIAGLFAL